MQQRPGEGTWGWQWVTVGQRVLGWVLQSWGWVSVAELGVMLPDLSPNSPRELTGEVLKSLRFPRFSLDLIHVLMASSPCGKDFHGREQPLGAF